MNGMETVRIFVIDYFRLMMGRPLMGAAPTRRIPEDRDARLTAERFSRGNVAIQNGRFVSISDLDNERDEVAEPFTRN